MALEYIGFDIQPGIVLERTVPWMECSVLLPVRSALWVASIALSQHIAP